MKSDCFDFRFRLSAALSSSFAPLADAQVQSLGWHEHLLHCGACRQLLEDEQALDQLLGSLPEPTLPEPQRQDLLVRLGENLALERLLDAADAFDRAPVGLSGRVRSFVAEKVQADPLDSQLEQVGKIEAPAGMNARILAYCKEGGQAELAGAPAPARGTSSRANAGPPGGPRSRRAWRHWASASLAAAAVALVLWYLPAINPTDNPADDNSMVATPGERSRPFEPSEAGEDAELLAMLDKLEVMDLVDELDGEDWALLDDYDRLGLFLVEDGSIEGQPSGETPR